MLPLSNNKICENVYFIDGTIKELYILFDSNPNRSCDIVYALGTTEEAHWRRDVHKLKNKN
jgi:hypothetical protein